MWPSVLQPRLFHAACQPPREEHRRRLYCQDEREQADYGDDHVLRRRQPCFLIRPLVRVKQYCQPRKRDERIEDVGKGAKGQLLSEYHQEFLTDKKAP